MTPPPAGGGSGGHFLPPLILTAVVQGPKKRKSRTGDLRRVSRFLRDFALKFPGATEDFPWGDRVAKVKGKIFVSQGLDPVPGGGMTLTVKLPASHEAALDLPFTAPTGYGLGKAGWVTATFGPGTPPPVDIRQGWIVESYRAVAPKKLVADLDARQGVRGTARSPAKITRTTNS